MRAANSSPPSSKGSIILNIAIAFSNLAMLRCCYDRIQFRYLWLKHG
jgi:hypothetical protein